MGTLSEISKQIIAGDASSVPSLTRQAISEGLPARDILQEGLIGGMGVIGEKFKAHEIFLPDVLMAARAMQAGMDELKPLLIKEDVPSLGKVVLGTVRGDLHDIGKNLVSIMLKGAGFEVIDLGNDVSPESFVDTALENEASVVAMSALLTTTMPVMGEVTDLIRQRGLDKKLKTIVGGAPLSDDAAREMGANAYAYDAASAVDRIRELLSSD
jgi:5-methyltetrahydrofolate--homocysteine methyltransferase